MYQPREPLQLDPARDAYSSQTRKTSAAKDLPGSCARFVGKPAQIGVPLNIKQIFRSRPVDRMGGEMGIEGDRPTVRQMGLWLSLLYFPRLRRESLRLLVFWLLELPHSLINGRHNFLGYMPFLSAVGLLLPLFTRDIGFGK